MSEGSRRRLRSGPRPGTAALLPLRSRPEAIRPPGTSTTKSGTVDDQRAAARGLRTGSSLSTRGGTLPLQRLLRASRPHCETHALPQSRVTALSGHTEHRGGKTTRTGLSFAAAARTRAPVRRRAPVDAPPVPSYDDARGPKRATEVPPPPSARGVPPQHCRPAEPAPADRGVSAAGAARLLLPASAAPRPETPAGAPAVPPLVHLRAARSPGDRSAAATARRRRPVR